MTDRTIDLHNSGCIYKSGFKKINEKREKQIKDEKLLSQTRRMTDFISSNKLVTKIETLTNSLESIDVPN